MKPRGDGRVRCSAWLGGSLMARREAAPESPPRTHEHRQQCSRRRCAVMSVHQWLQLCRLVIAQRSRRTCVRMLVLLLDPVAAMLWPRTRQGKASGLRQNLARWLVTVAARPRPASPLMWRYEPNQLAILQGYVDELSRCGALPPNDPSSATRPTRAHDCNLDAMAGFAAAHG